MNVNEKKCIILANNLYIRYNTLQTDKSAAYILINEF